MLEYAIVGTAIIICAFVALSVAIGAWHDRRKK